jgi:hypothetical protein
MEAKLSDKIARLVVEQETKKCDHSETIAYLTHQADSLLNQINQLEQ